MRKGDEELHQRCELVIQKYVEQQLNKASVARDLGISRERVGQIVKRATGTKNPILKYAQQLDWRLLNELRITFGISYTILANRANTNPVTSRHIFSNALCTLGYRKNTRQDEATASIRLANTLLTMVDEKLNNATRIINEIDKVIDKKTEIEELQMAKEMNREVKVD